MYRSGERGFKTRGTSVLAALVFVAILSAIAYSVHELSPRTNANQTAAADAAASTATPSKTAPEIPLCSDVNTKDSTVDVTNSNTAPKQPCVCRNPAANGKPETFQSFKYTISPKLTNGAADAQTHRTITGTAATENSACIVEICPPGAASGDKACTTKSSFSSEGLNESLVQSTAQVKTDVPTMIAQSIASGKVEASSYDGKVSPAMQTQISDAFAGIKSESQMVCTQGACTEIPASDPRLISAQEQIKNISTCDGSNCKSDVLTTPSDTSKSPVTDTTSKDQVTEKPTSYPQSAYDQMYADNCASGDKAACDVIANQKQTDAAACSAGDNAACSRIGASNQPSAPQGPCPNGTIMGPDGCPGTATTFGCSPACTGGMQCVGNVCRAPAPAPGPGPGPGTGTGAYPLPAPAPQGQGGSGVMGALTGFLQGLARGLGVGQPAVNSNPPIGNQVPQPPGTCAPNYVCQNNTMYQRSTQCVDTPVQTCQYGCNGSSCATSPQTQCPTPPPQPDPSQCQGGSWQQQMSTIGTGQQCLSGWQCVQGAQPIPTAQISCNPAVVDQGMSIAISYSCGNSVQSAGINFASLGQLSGSTSTIAAGVVAGTNSAIYGIACINGQNRVATSTCSVQIARPGIVLVAQPKTVAAGGVSRIGWTTSGMNSCVVSSPDSSDFTSQNAGFTSTSGMATTTPLSADMRILLTCQTLGGNVKIATTTVSVSQTAGSVSVHSSVDGSATVTHGSAVRIDWTAANAPANSAISLWLFDLRTNAVSGLIAGAESASGTYTWNIPANGAPCSSDSPAPCAGDLVAGRQYGIEAALYTPSNAYLGGLPQPGAPDPQYLDFGYTEPQFTLSQ